MKTPDVSHQQACAEWPNRILLLSLLGIAYLTLFPFRFDLAPTTVFHRSPFLLRGFLKRVYYFDFFLNVLLFVPFGFGISALARKRGCKRWTALFLALATGACASYVVELLQFYIPARDSGWQDVFSNTTGSIVGFFLFELCGGTLLEELSRWEAALEGWLSATRAALLLAAYFLVIFGVSARLQSDTRLSNWDPQSILVVGNDASGQNPWKGQVFRLQIWNRALSDRAIRRIAGQISVDDVSTGLLGSYDFAGSPPYRDQRNFLPALDWTPARPQFAIAGEPEWSARSWLSTTVPVENLMREIMKSNQFTVHFVCAPAVHEDVNGRILSFSRSAGNVNFLLRQQGQFLVFRLRTPLSTRRALLGLTWYVPGAFEPGKVRDIVASYDGSDGFIYLDGNRIPQDYRLSPGTSLVHALHFIETEDLGAYVIVFETLVFLPAGLLIGVAIRKWAGLNLFGRCVVALAWVLPAALLEIFLMVVSGRRIWAGDIAFSLVFGLAGILLINADGIHRRAA